MESCFGETGGLQKIGTPIQTAIHHNPYVHFRHGARTQRPSLSESANRFLSRRVQDKGFGIGMCGL